MVKNRKMQCGSLTKLPKGGIKPILPKRYFVKSKQPLRKSAEEKRKKILSLYRQYIKETIATSPEARLLAEMYISKGIIPEKYRVDALHISIATVNALDFVISFNHGHIVKTKTMIGTGFANLRYGFRQIGLCTPTEVSEYDF